jgi:hypothetical protein
MGAEEERRPAVRCVDARVEVARVGADAGSGVVLVHVEAEIAHVRRDPVGDRALIPGRARQCRELGEQRDDVVLRHAAILGRPTRS